MSLIVSLITIVLGDNFFISYAEKALIGPTDASYSHSTAMILNSSLIYSPTTRVVGAPQMMSQPVSSFFPCSPLPSGTWRTPGLSIA